MSSERRFAAALDDVAAGERVTAAITAGHGDASGSRDPRRDRAGGSALRGHPGDEVDELIVEDRGGGVVAPAVSAEQPVEAQP